MAKSKKKEEAKEEALTVLKLSDITPNPEQPRKCLVGSQFSSFFSSPPSLPQ